MNKISDNWMASDDSELQRMMEQEAQKRRELAERLKKKAAGGNAKIEVGKGQNKLEIGEGVLASDDSELQRMMEQEAQKRRELADRLKKKAQGSNEKIVVGKGQNKLEIGEGVLAAQQWYEKDPELLEGEKFAMSCSPFKDFTMFKLPDGRLAWKGDLNTNMLAEFPNGILEAKTGEERTYTVWAVYLNNHPEQRMGSSVRVYPVYPSVKELIDELGYRPYHLLYDEVNNQYLCTTVAEAIKTGRTKTTAVSVLLWALKWLAAYELVMTGDLAKEDFMTHGKI